MCWFSLILRTAGAHSAFAKLELSGLQPGLKGLPSVVALCTRKNTQDTKHVPYHVVTTTLDRWDGFNTIHKFFKEARQSRTEADPFKSYEGDIRYIEQKSLKIVKEFKPNKNFYDLRRSTNDFDHRLVYLRPLQCPSFTYKSRCVRCQILFGHCIEPEFMHIEEDYRYSSQAAANGGLKCAEPYAHFYCKAYFQSGSRCTTCHFEAEN